MNQIIINGNINNVELKTGKSGKEYATFSLKHYTRKSDGTYSHGILFMKAFGDVAKRLAKFKNGSPLEIEASFSFGSYTDENGKTKYTVDYVVNRFSGAGNGAYMERKGAEDTTTSETTNEEN